MMKNDGFDTIRHDVDLCVVGGGHGGPVRGGGRRRGTGRQVAI